MRVLLPHLSFLGHHKYSDKLDSKFSTSDIDTPQSKQSFVARINHLFN